MSTSIIPQNVPAPNPNINQVLIDGLRQLADFLEARPTLPKFGSAGTTFCSYVNKQELLDAAKQFGSCRKTLSPAGNTFDVERSFGPLIGLTVFTNRSNICERVQVGTHMVEHEEVRDLNDDERQLLAGMMVKRLVEEPLYEYVCPETPVLGGPS